MAIRLLGVRLTNFEGSDQLGFDLFPTEKKKQEILSVVDDLRKKFGDDVIHIGKV